MSTCAVINNDYKLKKAFTSLGYPGLVKAIFTEIDENSSGYFYDVDKIADSLKDFKKSFDKPFNKSYFINVFNSEFQKRKVFSNTNSFFNKPLSKLYNRGGVAKVAMLNSFEQAMIKAVFIDGDISTDDETSIQNAVTLDNSHVNYKIQRYKNNLFNILVEYLKNSPTYKDTYENLSINTLYENKNFIGTEFDRVISDIAEAFKDFDTKRSIHNDANKKLFKVYNAAVILTNFDSLIESNFKDLVAVNQYNTDALTTPPYSYQYIQIFKGTTTQYWNRTEAHSDDSSDKYASNLLKMIANNIPLRNAYGTILEDRFLGSDRLQFIAAYINKDTAMYLKFMNNPKKELKRSLQELIISGTANKATLKSLYDYLYDSKVGIASTIEAAKDSNPDIASNIIDVEAVIARYLSNVTVPMYGIISTKKTNDKKNTTKRYVQLLSSELAWGDTQKRIIKHIDNTQNISLELKPSGVIYNNKAINIDYTNKQFKDLIEEVVGINIPTVLPFVKSIVKNDDIQTNLVFYNLLQVANTIKTTKNISEEEALKLLNSNKYLNIFFQSVSETTIPNAQLNFNDAKGNSIPTTKVKSLGSEFKLAFEDVSKEFTNTSANLLLENRDLIVDIETPLEVEIDSDEAAIDFAKLTVDENFNVNFKENYLNLILDNKNISVKLTNFSDKGTIFNPIVNSRIPITFNEKNYGNLKEMSLNTLKTLNNNTMFEHYKYVINTVFNEYLKLSNKKGIPYIVFEETDSIELKIQKINNFLNSGINIVEVIYGNAIKNPELKIVSEVHYSAYKEGKKTIYKFNDTLKHYYDTAKNNTFTSNAEQAFIAKSNELNIPDDISSLIELHKYGNNIQERVANISKQLGISYEETSPFIVENSFNLTIQIGDKIILNPIVAKWLHTQNLIRSSFLGMITKHEYQHPHKSKATNLNIEQEITGRNVSMTKRMVIYPATLEFYMQGLDYGIDDSLLMAVVEDLNAISFNTSGESKSHESHDGSIFANPLLTYLLKKSFVGKDLADVQKLIGHHSGDIYSTFIKCALFTPTNERIKKSLKSSVNLDSIMKRLNSIPIEPSINLSKNSLGNIFDIDKIITNGLYYPLHGTTYKVQNFEKILGSDYKITLIDTATYLPITYTTTINNLYDLWKVFGGSFSQTKVGESFIDSEGSIEMVGNIIGSVTIGGKHVLKQKMIGIMATSSAIKNGAVNINPVRVLTEDIPLAYSKIGTKFLGVQLDAYHASDDAVINEISQVIAALSQGQSSPELYLELYSAIGDIIQRQIDKFTLKNKDKVGNFDLQKISKIFMEALLNDDQLGTAREIVEVLNTNIKEEVILPISNNNFYNQFIIKVISGLKSDFIKRKYRGLGAVMNPSYGMIQLFEYEGNTYFADDLLDLAIEEDYLQEVKSYDPQFGNSQIINSVINRLFKNEDIDINDIQPLDRISINGKEILLDDIEIYYKVKNALQNNDLKVLEKLKFINSNTSITSIQLVKNKPRDLKPSNITWIQDINSPKKVNIFDAEAIRLNWAYKTNNLTQLEEAAILKLFKIDNLKTNPKKTDKLFSLWIKRTHELLHEGYIYKSIFENDNIFEDDELINKLDLSNYKNLEKITDYTHTHFEAILPKMYKSDFNLGNTKYKDINEDFFKEQVSNLFNDVDLTSDVSMVSLSGNVINIHLLTHKDIKDLNLELVNTVNKKINDVLYRVDIKGNPIYKISPEFKVYLQNGKEILVLLKDSDQEKEINFIAKLKTFITSNNELFEMVIPIANNSLKYIHQITRIAKNTTFLPLFRNYLSERLKDINTLVPEDNTAEGIVVNNIYLNELNKDGKLIDILDIVKPALIEDLSKILYTSWQKSNYIVSARIPAQSKQSFMAMKNVGYLEEAGNNVFVSHFQLWLQGSDFDIDKAYILGHNFKNGVYKGWSPFFTYSSFDQLTLSEKLPIPNKNIYTIEEDIENVDSIDVSKYESLILDSELSLENIVELLTLVNNNKPKTTIKIISKELGQQLLNIINKHNSYLYTTDALKNFVVKNIIATGSDARSQVDSTKPVTMGVYDKVKERADNSFILSSYDGVSMDQQQWTNQVGKEVIGIAANGIKDYFALITYFSQVPLTEQVNKLDNNYFEREFTFNGKVYKTNRIAGLNLTKTAADILNSYIQKELKELELETKDGEVINLDDYTLDINSDPSLVLSSLLSAATDNAKELILSKINASQEFASMHIYLLILGFDATTIAEFMTSENSNNILRNLNRNIFKSINKIYASKIINTHGTPEFKKVYNLASELNFLAELLKINQGLKANLEELYKYLKGVEGVVKKQDKIFAKLTINSKNKDLLSKILHDKPYLNTPKNINKIKDTIAKAEDLKINTNFSFKNFLENSDYNKVAVDYYNLIKGSFNILDIINTLPNFKKLIEATKLSYDLITASSAKARFQTEEAVEILRESKVTSYNYKVKDDTLNTNQFKNSGDTFDDQVIEAWLKTLNYKLDLNKVEDALNIKVSHYDTNTSKFIPLNNESIILDFKSPVANINFKKFIEDTLVPYLKKQTILEGDFANNKFLKELTTRNKKDRSWLSTLVTSGKTKDPKNIAKQAIYKDGVQELIDNNSSITVDGIKYPVIDLLFLYNVIVNKDKPGKDRLTIFLEGAITNTNNLTSNFYKFYSDVDKGKDLNLYDPNLLKSITYGVLKSNGYVRYNDEKGSSGLTLSNPNFTLSSGIEADNASYKKFNMFNTILNTIKSKNILINFKCE